MRPSLTSAFSLFLWLGPCLSHTSTVTQLIIMDRRRRSPPPSQLDEFDAFLVPHLANNKLFHRGRGVTPVAAVKRRLDRLRAACEAMGVRDSMLLPREQQVLPEEAAEVEAALGALHDDKRDKADHHEAEEEGEGEEQQAPAAESAAPQGKTLKLRR